MHEGSKLNIFLSHSLRKLSTLKIYFVKQKATFIFVVENQCQ